MEISLLRCPGGERKETNRNNNKSPGALPASVRQSSKTISQDGGASGWLVEEPPRKTSGALLADARAGGCLGVCAGGGAAGSPQPRVKGKVRPERGGPTGRLGQMREPRGFAIAGPAGVGQSRRRAGAREKPTAVSLRPPEGVCSHTPARARTHSRTTLHTFQRPPGARKMKYRLWAISPRIELIEFKISSREKKGDEKEQNYFPQIAWFSSP